MNLVSMFLQRMKVYWMFFDKYKKKRCFLPGKIRKGLKLSIKKNVYWYRIKKNCNFAEVD